MVSVELVASTRPVRVEPLSKPDAQWCKALSGWSCPGRFAFFVFRINLPFDTTDWFPGLEQFYDHENGHLFVGGSFDKWDRACYALLRDTSPHDCCAVYRQIHKTLTNFGWVFRGERTSPLPGFYLK